MLKTVRIQESDSAHKVLILLHGLGSSADNWHDIALALKLPESVEIILPQAPTRAVTIAEGLEIPAWFDIYGRGEGVPEDGAGIAAAAQEIQQLIESLKLRGISPNNIVIGGFSQGGALALYYACHSQEALAGVMVLSGYLPLWQTFFQSAVQKIPVFMSHGEYDDVIPLHYAQISHDMLEQQDFSVNWRTYPVGHSLNEQMVEDISVWLQTQLLVSTRNPDTA